MPRPRLLPTALGVAVTMVLLVGFGRVYLGLHWPTDVLAGWAIGGAQAALAITWLERSRTVDADVPHGRPSI